MRKTIRILGFPFLGVLGLATGYLFLLCFPQPLFAYKFSTESITLYCDDSIPAGVERVLQDVQSRLEKCPLYMGHPHQNVFVCNHSWRYKLFTNRNSGAGGLAYGFAPWNIFLRKSDIARNDLFTRQEDSSGPDRPLSYFIAHEITHNLTVRFIGPLAYERLPAWKKEGYADYVGKGGQFDFKKIQSLFKKNDPSLDPKVSGLYLRYHLLVAELLDRRKVTVGEMLKDDYDRGKLEADLRAN
jgi:hypothetical protein